MGNRINMSETKLINMISKIVSEQRAGFGYGFFQEQVDEEGVDIMSTLDQNASWSKLKQFFKDYYTNVKVKVADVSPSEFNEIEMVLDAVVSLGREINLNNKSPEVIAQQLKRHMKDLMRASEEKEESMEKNKPQKEAPPLEEGRKLFRRLKKKLTESSSCDSNGRKIRIENCANGMGISTDCVTVDGNTPVVGQVVQNISNGWTGVWGTVTHVWPNQGGPTLDFPEVVSCNDTTPANTGNVCTGSCEGWANYDNWCDNFSNLPNMTSPNPNQPCQFICQRHTQWTNQIQNVGPVWANQLQCKIDRVDELMIQYGCANSSASNC